MHGFEIASPMVQKLTQRGCRHNQDSYTNARSLKQLYKNYSSGCLNFPAALKLHNKALTPWLSSNPEVWSSSSPPICFPTNKPILSHIWELPTLHTAYSKMMLPLKARGGKACITKNLPDLARNLCYKGWRKAVRMPSPYNKVFFVEFNKNDNLRCVLFTLTQFLLANFPYNQATKLICGNNKMQNFLNCFHNFMGLPSERRWKTNKWSQLIQQHWRDNLTKKNPRANNNFLHLSLF